MVTFDQLEVSKDIQRRTGLTFHIATRFLPKRVRHATYILYAFFRVADEVVDDPDPAPARIQRRELARIRDAALGKQETSDPVLAAFAEMRERYGIPDREIELFIDAMDRDVTAETNPTPAAVFPTPTEMEAYLRGSAVSVGYMMLAVMEPDDPTTARPHASALGEAFQLTNFLRDVREDIDEYQRVYIPRTTLDRTGTAVADIIAYRPTPGFREAIRLEVERAEQKYRDGVAGITYLPKDCQFPVLLASVFYAEYHRLIRDRHYDVLTDPPTLRALDYARLIVKTWIHWRRTGDPEQTFYHIAPIDQSSSTGHESDKQRSRLRVLNRYFGQMQSSWQK